MCTCEQHTYTSSEHFHLEELRRNHARPGQRILGDPEAVSRVGRKDVTKVFKNGRKSPWVPTLTELFPNLQADAGS